MYLLIVLLLVLALLTTIIYVFIIGKISRGIYLESRVIYFGSDELIMVTVIIAARNEEETIGDCLDAITSQRYPRDLFEIIVVDDSSEDATCQVVETYIKRFENISLIKLDAQKNETGKKAAITKAVKTAKGELIVTTDADCVMQENWLRLTVGCQQEYDAKMVVGSVCYLDEKNIFEKMQSLEFMSLMGSGIGSLSNFNAILCNGANLAFTKKIFDEMNGYETIDSGASGDDVLLMYKISKEYEYDILPFLHEDAIVYTRAKATFREFINQRKRWASKKFSDFNSGTKFVSLLIYFENLMLFLLFISACFYTSFYFGALSLMEIVWILIGIKSIVDYILLYLTADFFNKKSLLIYFIPLQLIYIPYIVIIAFLGWTGKYEWKNRKVK